jgi:hypothetical protein
MEVDLIKQTFNKKMVDSTLNRNFIEFTNKEPEKFFDVRLATLEDFFILYNSFFYDIPKEGINSHSYIVEKSKEYIGTDSINKEIEALLQEITELREENLSLVQENLLIIQQNTQT